MGRCSMFCVAVLLVGMVTHPALAAFASAGLQAIERHLFTGEVDGWMGQVRNGAYWLQNPAEQGGIRYFFAPYDPADAGRRTISIDVDTSGAAPGAGAGLLYGYSDQPRTYYMVLISGQDKAQQANVEIYKRDASGIRLTMGSSVTLGQGMNTVSMRERGREVEVLVNGRSISSFSSSGTGQGAVGIAAMGLGQFGFSNFRLVGIGKDAGGNRSARSSGGSMFDG